MLLQTVVHTDNTVEYIGFCSLPKPCGLYMQHFNCDTLDLLVLS